MTRPAISKIMLVERMMRQKLSQKNDTTERKNIKKIKKGIKTKRERKREEKITQKTG